MPNVIHSSRGSTDFGNALQPLMPATDNKRRPENYLQRYKPSPRPAAAVKMRRLAAVAALACALCVSHADSPPAAPTSFQPLEEWHAFVASLRASAPGLIQEDIVIGRTVEDRPMKAFCMGACSDSSAPALFVTTMHHGREPMGALATLHYLRQLVAEYIDNKGETVALLRSRRIWVVLSVNPDAYAFNLEHQSNNQVMARKNRRAGCAAGMKPNWSYQDVGVDLNRNYDFAWDLDNLGSNPDICAEDYRGTGPFSEPESAAIRDFMKSVNAKGTSVAINWHSYARFINVPYAVQSRPQPPDDVYAGLLSLAGGMSAASGYGFGHPWTGGLYTCNGEASDWMTALHLSELQSEGGADVSSSAVYAFSPEIGPTLNFEPFSIGMWPRPNMIPEILQEAVPLMDYAFKAASSYLRVFPASAGAFPSTAVSQPAECAAGEAANSIAPAGAACAKASISFEIANKGARASVGTVVAAVMHQSAAGRPVAVIDATGKPQSITVADVLFAPPASAARCMEDAFPAAVNGAGAPSSLRALAASVGAADVTEQQSVVEAHQMAAVRRALASIKAEDGFARMNASKLDFRTIFAAGSDDIMVAAVSSDKNSGSSGGRLLDAPASSSVFSSRFVPSMGGGIAASKSRLGAFKKWTPDSLSLEIRAQSDPAQVFAADSHGFWAYTAVSDERMCAIYGLAAPGPVTGSATTTMASTATQLYVGSSGCLPCALFRQGPAPDATPSPSPAPSVAPAAASPSPSPSPAAAAAASATASPTSSAQPWNDNTYPSPSPHAADSSSVWPWSNNGVGTQVLLIVLGLVGGTIAAVLVARRMGIISIQRRRYVTVPGSGDRSNAAGRSQAGQQVQSAIDSAADDDGDGGFHDEENQDGGDGEHEEDDDDVNDIGRGADADAVQVTIARPARNTSTGGVRGQQRT